MSKEQIPKELQQQLKEFHVDIPKISMKKSKIERFANWIYAPARDPLELLSIKGNSIMRLTFYPLFFIFALSLAPLFFI